MRREDVFGLNVKVARKKKKLTQENLAEVVEVSRNLISLIERGKTSPTILKVIDMAHALETDVSTLIDGV